MPNIVIPNNGVLLIDKSAGSSSAQVLSRLKKRLMLDDKIGHAGTLDPFATGLLVVLLGKATRLADLFQGGRKTYQGIIKLGLVTDTDDVTGATIATSQQIASYPQIEEAALAMIGNLEQVPPKISALKIKGKRAYELAREGTDFELKARSVQLYSLKLQAEAHDEVSFEIECSKGFYVRSLARDLGQQLGCGACLKTLRRKASEPFNVAFAPTVDHASLSDLIAWDNAISLLGGPELAVEDREFAALQNGLVPYSLFDKTSVALDSDVQDLVVYRRASDGQAGGLLSCAKTAIKIAVNM